MIFNAVYWLSSIVILNVVGFDYRSIINGISKSGTMNLSKTTDLSEKSGSL